jgi:EAL domain-containing protein (putative c-di-GMP-specific phosphodiesterase class I)
LLPDTFVAVAEEMGLISEIGSYVLEESCRQARAWHLEYCSDQPLTITVNVSPKQFTQSKLLKDVEEALRNSGLNPNALQLEVTESAAMSDPARTAEILANIRQLGVRICIDDFGTGHSSLSRLEDFPVHTLKIDRSFVTKMSATNDCKMIRLILALAQSLNLKVVAEGIDNDKQVETLRDLGCEFGQGFFFSKAVADDAVCHLLAKDAGKVAIGKPAS